MATMSSNEIERFEVAATYSEVVVHSATIYLSGQIPENTGGKDITEQTKDVLMIIEQRLSAVGGDKSRILSATIYLTNLERDYKAMNEVWNSWVPSGTAPARTTVGVASLASSQWLLEITVTAARK
jgi:enamine deaminase RidA (YjgF/YER057c/UK114 family)